MFLSVTTNDGDVAAVNSDNITHITIAAFNGHGCKIYFISKEGLSVRDTMEEVLKQINSQPAQPAQSGQPAQPRSKIPQKVELAE